MMVLTSARAGLTNYYHNQVNRRPIMDIDSRLIDELTSQNLGGGITSSTISLASVMSGGLNYQPDGWSSISGGFNESKGLMMLSFQTKDSQVQVEYMHVIGYITNNADNNGLSTGAIFHPSMSWKTEETLTSSLNLENPVNVTRRFGHRTDYLYNDGSDFNNKSVSLRPNDIIEYGLNQANAEDALLRMEEEGLPFQLTETTVASSDISRVGLVMSRRQNLNPTSWAKDILTAGTDYQRNSHIGSGQFDIPAFDGMYGELTALSHKASGAEPSLVRDDFFRTMMENMGQGQIKGFNGYTIGDIMFCFNNLNEVLDLTVMDASQFQVHDYTQTSEAFGTSQYAEIIQSEIESNILDLMTKYGLNGISIRGSNADTFGGTGTDNIILIPYNVATLDDDDYYAGQKAQAFCDDLRNQIFTKLNGLSSNEMTPLRFQIEAELFGTCQVHIQLVDTTNSNSFSMDDSGNTIGMIERSFPTFAVNATSPILGSGESARTAGANFFSNIESYFK